MFEVKQGQSIRIPVRFEDASGSPVINKTYADVDVTAERADGTTVEIVTDDAGDFYEVTTGAFSGTGKYTLVVPASVTSVPGALCIAVFSTGLGIVPVIVINVVANLEVDTYARLGAPAGATIAADIQATNTPYVSFLGGGETVKPVIYSVTAPRKNMVRVTYSESVVMTTAANGALNLGNYSIPGLTISDIVKEAENQVLLTTSPQTSGVMYNLTILNVEDLNGNVIA